MIYGASLGSFIKKAYADKGFQTNVDKIMKALSVDPAVSGMDAIVLGPKDMQGAKGRVLDEIIKKKHPSIQVVYLFQKEKEMELVTGEAIKVKVSKFTLESIQEELVHHLDFSVIEGDSRVIQSEDNKMYAYSASATETTESPTIENEPSVSPSTAEPEEQEAPPVEQYKSIEQRIAEMGRYADFNFFRQMLMKDSIYQELFQQNNDYAELVNLLEMLDQKIATLFKDISLTAEERFEAVKQIGVQRSAYKGIHNNIVADKVLSIMEAIVQSAELTVDARVDSIRKALDTISTAKLLYQNQEKLDELIQSRLHIQMELMELSKEIIEVYKAMDRSVAELLTSFDEDLVSNNAYVNEVMKTNQALFTPQNVAALTSKLVSDLQQNRVSLSIVEDKIKSLINLVFRLCEEDTTIIEYQQKLIHLLMAQRVEDVVIVDSIIKNALRLFVGPADTGRTATALAWSGVVSRRQNTLLIDLTGYSKLREYGIETVDLDHFLTERLERQLVCVEGSLEELSRVDQVVAELKTRLNYYAHIHILLDATQVELLNQLAPSALAVHFITDCTPRGTKLLQQAVEAFKEENIARKVIVIDPPVDPIRILNDLSIDPMTAKLIIIPHLPYMRACSINHTKPYESREVVEVFEEAFR